MTYKVCIPTAGIGSRLGDFTQYINKSLVSIANRPILCHLIEQFSDDVEFVIALGYKGHLVRQFIELAYPKRKFFFVDVLPYEGVGSGLGLSLLKCREYLQEPFIFISCDTLVKEAIPKPNHNWMAYSDVDDLTQYRTISLNQNVIVDICEKGIQKDNLQAYIGLAGIQDYQTFWETMQKGGDSAISMGEVYGLRSLLKNQINAYPFTWFDTGNIKALEKAREVYKEPNSPNILDKANEAIWFVGDKVIKYSDDNDFIKNRVKRVQYISDYVPQLLDIKTNMYHYQKVQGKVMSEVVTVPLFNKLLETCKTFWQTTKLEDNSLQSFQQTCRSFYEIKTRERVNLFYKNFKKIDSNERINDETMPKLSELLDNVDWGWMSEGLAGRYHGDFHFENILWTTDEKFIFLDWRQEFGGSLTTGDIYYDLAKLMHGLIISHKLIVNNHFTVRWNSNAIEYGFYRTQILVECERLFNHWLEAQGYDVKKVRVLTALIYLNIAALHHYPYSLLLYALGKKMLKEELEK